MSNATPAKPVVKKSGGLVNKTLHFLVHNGFAFTVSLMRGYNMITAKEKMEDLRKYIESNPTIFFNKRIPITSTIGLEEYKAEFNEPEEIIKVADARMYYGKQHGRNILIFEDLD